MDETSKWMKQVNPPHVRGISRCWGIASKQSDTRHHHELLT